MRQRTRAATARIAQHLRAARTGTFDDPSAPLVLIFPPGGFGMPSTSVYLNPAIVAARAAGFRPLEVHYPVWDPLGAWKYAVQTAFRTGAQYAYGESAGGTLAGRLAQTALVERASLNAPISDLFTWPFPAVDELELVEGWGMNAGDRYNLSPKFHESLRPIDIVHSVEDTVVPFSDSAIWADGDPLVTLREVDGPHISGPSYDSKLGLAFAALRGPSPTDQRA